MLPCKTCIHKKDVEDNKFSCSKGAAIVSHINQEAAQNNLFMWPLSYEPQWAENCIGYFSSEIDLNLFNKKELENLFIEQLDWFKIMKENEFQYVHPENSKKVETNIEEFQKMIQTLDYDFDKWSEKDLILAIKSIINI